MLLVAQSYLGGHSENLPYSDFKKLLAAGQLEDLSVGPADIRGTVRTDGLGNLLAPEKIEALRRTGDGRHGFVTTRVEDDTLVADLERAPRFSAPLLTASARTHFPARIQTVPGLPMPPSTTPAYMMMTYSRPTKGWNG